MQIRSPRRSTRRQPRQRRAQQTVDAILQAVVKLLERDGAAEVTTNRIAEAAGVSIGSLYQYFPDKGAIFQALHDRHVERVGRLIEDVLLEHADAKLEAILRALLDALIDCHAASPGLYALLATELPGEPRGAHTLQTRLRRVLRLALSAHGTKVARRRELERTSFIVAHMLDAFAHGAVLDRPRQLTLRSAKDEALKALVAYLRA